MQNKDWISLRSQFIPELDENGHKAYLSKLSDAGVKFTAFIALTDQEQAAGFAEVSIRSELVNGCRPGRVLYLEGIYVRPNCRKQGVAKYLCNEIEKWGRRHGCSEFASDVFENDADSMAVHLSLGFTESERVVFYRKLISPE